MADRDGVKSARRVLEILELFDRKKVPLSVQDVTGDLGYRDDDGVFYFAGRSADWIRVDGENFAAAPIERILGRHPDLAAVDDEVR